MAASEPASGTEPETVVGAVRVVADATEDLSFGVLTPELEALWS